MNAEEKWKGQARQTTLMNRTLDAFLEPGKNANGSDIRITKAESIIAQEKEKEVVSNFEEKRKKKIR